MKSLPTGMQDFKEIIENNYIYMLIKQNLFIT